MLRICSAHHMAACQPRRNIRHTISMCGLERGGKYTSHSGSDCRIVATLVPIHTCRLTTLSKYSRFCGMLYNLESPTSALLVCQSSSLCPHDYMAE
jgi:hypothetical protein